MAEFGHIKISRKAYASDQFWTEARVFSKWEAWEWLLQAAAWKAHQRVVGTTTLRLERGELLASYRFLADAWGWSVKKVRGYLAMLVRMERIRAQRETQAGTVYLLVNYATYQDVGQAEGIAGAQRGHTEGTPGAHQGHKGEAVKAGEAGESPSVHQSAREDSPDEEEHTSLVIRLANRGMSDNPQLDPDRVRPILPTHGDSRSAIAAWRAAGVDWPTIEASVYDRASKYKPTRRYQQIASMAYFTAAVLDAHERRATAGLAPPEPAAENGANPPLQFLSGDPAVQEWATRLDAQLRSSLEESHAFRAEVEAVRQQLYRHNTQERDFARMKPFDQEAFVWVRVLNWYGEKVGDPKPAGRRLAAVGT